jgi:hypothetical protein
MAQGDLLRVEPDPELPGGYLFHREGADPLYSWGPEAEALAQKLSAAPDVRTAGPGGGDINDYLAKVPVDPSLQVHRTPEAGSIDAYLAAQQKSQAMPANAPGGRITVAGPPAPPPPQPSGPPPMLPGGAPPSGAVPAAPAEPAYEPMTPGYVSSAGVSRAQLEKKAGQGVEIPQTVSREVEGAIPYDPNAAEARGELSLDKRMLADEMAQRESAQYRAQELHAAATLPKLEMQAAEAEHQYQTVRNNYERERADLEQMLQANRERRVDPNRWFTQKSTGGQIATMLGLMLTTFASTMTGQENQGLRMIENIKEADIRAQEHEINLRGKDADNALAMLVRRYGDMNQAKAALRLAMGDTIAMQREEMIAGTKSQAVLDANRMWDIDWQMKREELERKIRDASIGKQTTRVAEKVAYPQAGGRRPETDEEFTKRVERAARRSVAEAKVRGGGVDPDVLARQRGEQGAKGAENIRKDTQELGKALSDTEEARRAYDATLAAAGLRFNEDTKRVEGYTGDIPGVGLAAGHLPDLLAGQEGRAVRQNVRNSIDMLMRARTGAAAPAAEIAKMEQFVYGSGTEEEFMRGLEMLRSQIDAARDMHRARFGQPVVENLERNRADVEAARSRKSTAAGVERY